MFYAKNSISLKNNHTDKHRSDLATAKDYSGAHFPLYWLGKN